MRESERANRDRPYCSLPRQEYDFHKKEKGILLMRESERANKIGRAHV